MEARSKSWLARLEPLCAVPVRRPRLILALLLLVGGVLGSGIFKIGFDPSTEKVFPEGHPAVKNYEAFRDAFGADESVFMAFEVPEGHTIYEGEALALARRLSREATVISGVDRAVSVADLPLLMLTPLGPRLVPGLPKDPNKATPETIKRWKAGIETAPLLEGTLISKDRRSTSVVVRLDRFPPGVAGAELNASVVKSLEDVVKRAKQAHPDVKFFLAGSPMIKHKIMQSIQDDLVTFAPPLVLVSLLVAGILLRSLRGPLLVVGVLILSVDVTLGTMGHLGIPLDPMTTLVPTLILVIGVADSLHLLVEQRAQVLLLGPEATGAETILAAAKHTLVPCLLTTATTMIGFGSLYTSNIPPISRFGVAAAMAAAAAFLMTFLLVPAVSALLPPPKAASGVAARAEGLASGILKRPRLFLIAALVFCGLLSLGWFKVRTETDFLAFFAKDDPLTVAVNDIQDRFSGVAPCEILIQGPAGCSRDPKVLAGILALERELESDPLVDFAFSAADIVAEANLLVAGTKGIPTTAEGVAQVEAVLKQIAGGELQTKQLISPPGPGHETEEWLRISVRARTAGSKKFKALADWIRDDLAKKHLEPHGVRAVPTGTSVVFGESADAIVRGQVKSFLFAFLAITAVMIVVLRSVRLGLLSAIPNLAPIACLMGAMGYMDIAFNSFSSMVGSIALGIAVDDTIHILVGFRRASEKLPLEEAVRETLSREGMALISTSIVLFCGFGVLLFGTFGPTREFGFLTAVAIAVALLGDLVILPGLLLLFPGLLGGALCKKREQPLEEGASPVLPTPPPKEEASSVLPTPIGGAVGAESASPEGESEDDPGGGTSEGERPGGRSSA
ncbi:MAG: RND family transporter [Planctomycetes bacterium]|nr:RND family transporter [Planctomycetota bacterium]